MRHSTYWDFFLELMPQSLNIHFKDMPVVLIVKIQSNHAFKKELHANQLNTKGQKEWGE